MTIAAQVVARDDEVIEQSGDFRSWALFGPCAMSDLNPECAPKRTFAHASGFGLHWRRKILWVGQSRRL
jgi:hypothetical protein